MKQECSNCFFHREGECRKKTPWSSGVNMQGHWPKTKPDDWCGEWRPQHD